MDLKWFCFRSQMNSLRRFLIQEVSVKHQKIALDRPSAEDITDEIEINRKWNLEIAEMREYRFDEMKKQRKDQILSSLQRQNIVKEEKLYILQDKVKKIEEQSKSFIAQDHLDNAINQTLANPVNFDYSINSKGEKFSGPAHEIEK